MNHETDRLAVTVTAVKLAWPHVASFTGAVISLSFVERLTNRGKAFAVFVGFFVATVLGPVGHALALHLAPFLTAEVVAPGINFLVALCAMAAIPGALKAISIAAGDPRWVHKLLRVQPDDDYGGRGYGRPRGRGMNPYGVGDNTEGGAQ